MRAKANCICNIILNYTVSHNKIWYKDNTPIYEQSLHNMPLSVNYHTLKENKFDYPFRIFISGSSQSGKTHFARELLSHKDVFQHNVQSIKYYHPDYLSNRPIQWHDSLDVPITYSSGLPTLDELCNITSHTCIVIDDLYEECINNKAIDYLFRVLSGKKTISVIVMSQRYFAQGRFGMNIRNNCNFTVLMRNVDARVNSKVACLINLKNPVTKAIEDTCSNNYYPYIFIDSSPRGQVSGYQVYTNIFDRFQTVFGTNGMKAYIIAEKDFLQYFKLNSSSTAESVNGKHETEAVSNRTSETDSSGAESAPNKWNRIHERSKKIRERRKHRASLQRY